MESLIILIIWFVLCVEDIKPDQTSNIVLGSKCNQLIFIDIEAICVFTKFDSLLII